MPDTRRAIHMQATIGLLLSVLVCGQPHSSLAQPVASDWESQIAGNVFLTQQSDSGTLNGDMSLGRYLPAPMWQVGVRQGLSYAFNDTHSDSWWATTTPFLEYHFLGLGEDGMVVPFLGAVAGAAWNDRDVVGAAGPEIGIKFFLDDMAFFTARYRYEWFFDDLNLGAGMQERDGAHIATLGMGIAWGGPERYIPVGPDPTVCTERVVRVIERCEQAVEEAESAAARAEDAARQTETTAPRIERGSDRMKAIFRKMMQK